MTSDLDHLTMHDKHTLWCAAEARRWHCWGSQRCYATLTSDQLAVEYIHAPECPRLIAELPPLEHHDEISDADAIDLRAGRTIELAKLPRPPADDHAE
jgi:hypothetical protein